MSGHVSICVCTFQRPEYLRKLLEALAAQRTTGLFTFDIVVVDNDRSETARPVCESFRSISRVPVGYYVEPIQNIALARNRAVGNATGDYVALIDDDEVPDDTWLLRLFEARERFQSDGVLGPVLPLYEEEPPAWVVKGRFHERPEHQTGHVLTWDQTRTGNALLKRAVFGGTQAPFKAEFGMGGEDREFFKRAISRGCRFVWCAEAPVRELVPIARCRRSFMLKRALHRGTIPQFGAADVLRSMIAVPLYTLFLPVALALGQHTFMTYLVKDFDHIGRLLAFAGVRVIREKYVTT
jgi:glycosyltransferase involved in cell wall biosynthesis